MAAAVVLVLAGAGFMIARDGQTPSAVGAIELSSDRGASGTARIWLTDEADDVVLDARITADDPPEG